MLLGCTEPCASELPIAGERLCLSSDGSPLRVSPGTGPAAGRYAGPFVCGEAGCEQREPPLPSDGEWECRDELGAIVCRGRGPAAGVVEGPRDPGFECARPSGPGEEICVALDPVSPPGGPHRCVIEHEHGEVRRCVPIDAREGLLAPCGDGCPAPLVCSVGVCVPPPRDEHGCWLDADCASRCVLGRCAR